MEKKSFGERISREKATAIINNRRKIMDSVNLTIISELEKQGADQDEIGALSFFKQDYNGFVFSKDLLKELFDLKLSNGASPEYLLVALGASNEGHDMAPTVIIAPCKAEKDNKGNLTVVSVNDKNPGGETPPYTILKAGFPDAGDDKSIQFDLI